MPVQISRFGPKKSPRCVAPFCTKDSGLKIFSFTWLEISDISGGLLTFHRPIIRVVILHFIGREETKFSRDLGPVYMEVGDPT